MSMRLRRQGECAVSQGECNNRNIQCECNCRLSKEEWTNRQVAHRVSRVRVEILCICLVILGLLCETVHSAYMYDFSNNATIYSSIIVGTSSLYKRNCTESYYYRRSTTVAEITNIESELLTSSALYPSTLSTSSSNLLSSLLGTTLPSCVTSMIITPSHPDISGSLWLSSLQPLYNQFDTTFSVRFSKPSQKCKNLRQRRSFKNSDVTSYQQISYTDEIPTSFQGTVDETTFVQNNPTLFADTTSFYHYCEDQINMTAVQLNALTSGSFIPNPTEIPTKLVLGGGTLSFVIQNSAGDIKSSQFLPNSVSVDFNLNTIVPGKFTVSIRYWPKFAEVIRLSKYKEIRPSIVDGEVHKIRIRLIPTLDINILKVSQASSFKGEVSNTEPGSYQSFSVPFSPNAESFHRTLKGPLGTLCVYVDNIEDTDNPLLSIPFSLASAIDLQAGSAYVGFLGKTTPEKFMQTELFSWNFS